ncbi:MAG TPA: MerR family transcriptional regulator [Chloroflexia bacterium]|nr:MerR family transcriptional regulator [Chloroflexia bacterium]
MFKIGDFARLSLIAVSALRYYDEVGLLKPLNVDRWTGYRYYSIPQLPRLNRIVTLKGLGFSLEEIAALLDGDLTPERLREQFRQKQQEIAARMREEQERLARVEGRLRYIELEGKMSEYEVMLKKVESQTVAFARSKVPDRQLAPMSGAVAAEGDLTQEIGRHCDMMVGQLRSLIKNARAKESGPWLLLYGQNDVDIDLEMDAPVEAIPPGAGLSGNGEEVGFRQLEGDDSVASVLHKGSYETILQAYAAIGAWIEENGYRIAGPCQEIYLHHDNTDASGHLVEVQFPVRKG